VVAVVAGGAVVVGGAGVVGAGRGAVVVVAGACVVVVGCVVGVAVVVEVGVADVEDLLFEFPLALATAAMTMRIRMPRAHHRALRYHGRLPSGIRAPPLQWFRPSFSCPREHHPLHGLSEASGPPPVPGSTGLLNDPVLVARREGRRVAVLEAGRHRPEALRVREIPGVTVLDARPGHTMKGERG
jgi:hypothetical protein